MTRLENSSLERPSSISLILFLKRNGETSLAETRPDVADDYKTIRKLAVKMEEEEIVELTKRIPNRRMFSLKLTEKGKKIADKLLEIEGLMNS